MASVRKEIETDARPKDAWAAIRDIGALHTRLVPGFVIATRVEPDARVVTFGNGIEIREPIVDLDDAARRLFGPPRAGAPRTTTRPCKYLKGPAGAVESYGLPTFCRTTKRTKSRR